MISVLEDAYIIPTTSAAGGKVPERESDVGKPDGAQSEGRLSSGSGVLCSGQTYGNDVPCSMSMITEHFYDKDTENAVNGIG